MSRILYLSADPGVPVLGHKGASVHVRELGRALVAEGVEVHVVSPRVRFEGEALPAGLRVHAIAPVQPEAHADVATLRAALEAQALEVTELADALEADAIYERLSLFGVAGVRAAAALKLPHALEVNAPLREEASRFRTLPHPRLAAELDAEVFAGTGRILPVSAVLAEMLTEQGADPDLIELQPNGVDAKRFPPPRRDQRRFVAGFAGSLKPWHGIETLIEAVARVPAVQLEVVGHGPLEGLLDRLPAERVTRFGALPHDRVLSVMAGWDAGLAPYVPLERFWFSPLKILEYMAAGSCPVATDLGDAAEVLGGGERGMLVPAGDPAALADALRSLVAERQRCTVLGTRARAWVRANRRWSTNARRVMHSLDPASSQVAA